MDRRDEQNKKKKKTLLRTNFERRLSPTGKVQTPSEASMKIS